MIKEGRNNEYNKVNEKSDVERFWFAKRIGKENSKRISFASSSYEADKEKGKYYNMSSESIDVFRSRRPKTYICRNCVHITVKIRLPKGYDYDRNDNRIPKDPKDIIRETALALKVTNESDFYCTFPPEWKPILHEETHFCGQFLLRENWQMGYQDIERTMESVDQVYLTRWDCKSVLREAA